MDSMSDMEPEDVKCSLETISAEYLSETSNEDCPKIDIQFQSRKLPSILNGKFYEVVETKGDNVTAQCIFCKPNVKFIKGSLRSTTNFLKHFKSKHREALNQYSMLKSNKQSADSVSDSNDFETNLLKFFITSRLPLEVIEDESFRKLVQRPLFDKKTLKEKIDKMLEENANLRRANSRSVKLKKKTLMQNSE